MGVLTRKEISLLDHIGKHLIEEVDLTALHGLFQVSLSQCGSELEKFHAHVWHLCHGYNVFSNYLMFHIQRELDNVLALPTQFEMCRKLEGTILAMSSPEEIDAKKCISTLTNRSALF